ncbi:hypothetical protein [Flavimarina sp. Hel_I_48]|uniref:hypothetical protein n=1 Tax=Flavimarina sp. Hel_I_48 TaxID=1392488 RepID=UPI001F1375E0|nr:hypothetical protein [Flavimarina sp. Hel_I_48]
MKKPIIIVLLTLIISSCTDINQMENSLKKIDSLRKENDSLKKIVADINSKFVFDSISFRDIYSPKNTYKPNSNFEVELLIVGYNLNKNYFVKFDSIVNGQKINPDTLSQSNGGFKYKTNLKEKENEIRIEMNIENEYGEKRKGTLFDIVRTKN